MNIYEKLPKAILPWYGEHKRDLPWRQDTLPYHIHLSEIMLQQTRVEAVKGYYTRFLQALPTVEALANADDELLQKLWEGLGYYSRVRNLKKAARVIVEGYGGSYPQTYEEVLGLPGVGPYTAGAICSIAFGQKTPAVDGNVLRLISRLTDDATPIDDRAFVKKVQEELAATYPEDAGAYTQALMELGATICGPNRAPDCENCPCKTFCLGYGRGTAATLPKKTPKRPRRREQYTVFILRCGNRYALQKRQNKGLLAGLWQFPNVPGLSEPEQAVEIVGQVREILRQTEMNHIFTHIEWQMRGIYLEVEREIDGYTWLTAEEIDAQVALPTAFRQFWDNRIE